MSFSNYPCEICGTATLNTTYCSQCDPCPECHGLRGDRAGICRTCNGSGDQETDNEDPEVFSYA